MVWWRSIAAYPSVHDTSSLQCTPWTSATAYYERGLIHNTRLVTSNSAARKWGHHPQPSCSACVGSGRPQPAAVICDDVGSEAVQAAGSEAIGPGTGREDVLQPACARAHTHSGGCCKAHACSFRRIPQPAPYNSPRWAERAALSLCSWHGSCACRFMPETGRMLLHGIAAAPRQIIQRYRRRLSMLQKERGHG